MSPMPFVPDRLLASVMSSAHLVSRSSTKKPKTSALTGAIIGVVIACICVALVVIVAVILLLRYRRKRMNISPPRVSFNPFTPTPSGHKGEIKSSAERVSLSSAQYVHFNGHKTNPSVSSSSTDLSAPMLPPVFPVPPAPVAQQPSDRLNGSFHPSVGGFNLATSTDGAWHARSPSDQSNTSTWSAAATAQRYIASVATPDQTSHPDYPNGRAVDGGPVPVTLLGGASASTGDWVGGSRALVNDLKQRPLPEPPKQNPAAGVSQWI